MSENLLALLRICLLALLYLFFLRVVRTAWVEIRGPRPARPKAQTSRRERARGAPWHSVP